MIIFYRTIKLLLCQFVCSLEFVSYFLDRNIRLTDLKSQLKSFTEQNNKLHDEQTIVQEKYNQVIYKYLMT